MPVSTSATTFTRFAGLPVAFTCFAEFAEALTGFAGAVGDLAVSAEREVMMPIMPIQRVARHPSTEPALKTTRREKFLAVAAESAGAG